MDLALYMAGELSLDSLYNRPVTPSDRVVPNTSRSA